MNALSKTRICLYILIIGLFYTSNVHAKVIYDKSGILITDIDIQNYAELYKQSKNTELSLNKIIKNLVIQKNILRDLEENNFEYLLELDRQIISEFGEENYNNNFIRDFIRFQKLRDEFIFDYYNNSLDILKFKKIIKSMGELKLPISNNNCFTVLQIIDLIDNDNFIENYFDNIKNNTSDFKVNLNNETYNVCLNSLHVQFIENKIVEFIDSQIKDTFNSFIYGKIEN